MVGGPQARTSVVGAKAVPSRLSVTRDQPRQVIGSDSVTISQHTESKSARMLHTSVGLLPDDRQLGNNPMDGNLLFPSQVAEVVSQSMGKKLSKSPSIRLLTSTSCGDVFLLHGLLGGRAVAC